MPFWFELQTGLIDDFALALFPVGFDRYCSPNGMFTPKTCSPNALQKYGRRSDHK